MAEAYVLNAKLSFNLIIPAVWPQYTSVTDKTGQRSDSVGRANRFTNGRPKTAEPIDLPFALWTRVGRRKHKFNQPLTLPNFIVLQHEVYEISVVEKFCPRKSRPKFTVGH